MIILNLKYFAGNNINLQKELPTPIDLSFFPFSNEENMMSQNTFLREDTSTWTLQSDLSSVILISKVTPFYGSCVRMVNLWRKLRLQTFSSNVIFCYYFPVILHYIGGASLVFLPYAQAYVVVIILTIYAVTMQNNITITVGLILDRIPTSIRFLNLQNNYSKIRVHVWIHSENGIFDLEGQQLRWSWSVVE